jgi:hypothetical protein
MKKLFVLFLITILHTAAFSQIHLGPGQQFSNIQEAASSIKPGDTVYLHAGAYNGYQFITNLKGNDEGWITITRYGNDEITIAGGWQFSMCEYLVFKKLTFKATPALPGRLFHVENGGSCETQSNHIIVDSCKFSGVTDANAISAFKFGGVDFFTVSNCVFRDIPNCSTIDFNVCHNGVIKCNSITNCQTGGHIKGGASNITMERNQFDNASSEPWVAFELGGDTGAQFYCPEDKFEVKNLKFYSNIVMGGYRGLALSSARDCSVMNNTFYNCGQATLRFLNTSVLYPNLSGNVVKNNIFSFGESAYINGSTQPADAADVSNNIYYSITSESFNGPYWDTPQLDLIKEKDPMFYGRSTVMFKYPNGLDFSIVEGSPAIGAATDEVEPQYDFYGMPFKKDFRSIGAVEYYGIPDDVEEKLAEEIVIYPNPAENSFTTSFSLDEPSYVKLELYDYMGRCLQTCSEGYYEAGRHDVRIDMDRFQTGVYFIRLKSDNRTDYKKIVINR